MEQSILIVEIVKEEGVRDLPLSVKGPFAKALKAEREGNSELAEKWLLMAVEAEVARKA